MAKRRVVRLPHFLIQDYFNEPGLDLLNRMLFAIASYNLYLSFLPVVFWG